MKLKLILTCLALGLVTVDAEARCGLRHHRGGGNSGCGAGQGSAVYYQPQAPAGGGCAQGAAPASTGAFPGTLYPAIPFSQQAAYQPTFTGAACGSGGCSSSADGGRRLFHRRR